MNTDSFDGNNVIRSIYLELKARRSSIAKNMSIYTSSVWERFDMLVDKLVSETGDEDYNNFKLGIKRGESGSNYVSYEEYNNKINGLIGKLEGAFGRINDEKLPANNQYIVNSQSQTQAQSLELLMQLNLDLQSKIDSKLFDKSIELTNEEKTFLERVKTQIAKVKDYSSLILVVLSHAKELGLTIEQILKLLA